MVGMLLHCCIGSRPEVLVSGFTPVDDLKQIDQEHIDEGIRSSCCLLVILNDETKEVLGVMFIILLPVLPLILPLM